MTAEPDTDVTESTAETDDEARDASPPETDAEDVVYWTCVDCGTVNQPDEVCGICGAEDPDEQAEDTQLTDAGVTDMDGDSYEFVPDARSEAPKENLVRFRASGPAAPSVLLRDDTAPGSGQSGSTMFGYFSTFNDWYEIDSYWEGTFLERVAPGAFSQTMSQDRAGMRVLYDHGFDPQLGNKPLGPIDVLREDSIGAYYEVPLLDTDYNRNFVLPALRGQLMSGQAVGSQLGASFRFIVVSEEWDYSGEITSFNPAGLPLRTITRNQVMEFGPVTFPANDLSTSGVRSSARSTTDGFISRLRSDPLSLARFTERTSAKVVERILAMPPSTTRHAPSTNAEPTADDVQATTRTRSFQLRARLALAESS